MRIVLSTSPHVRHPAVLQNDFTPDPSAMYTFAPVGLLALTAVLRQDIGLEPVLFDLNRNIATGAIPLDTHFYRNAAERICAQEPDVVGFMTECDSYHHVLRIAEQVKRSRPACRVVLGGPHATATARPTLERCSYIDDIVLGEGEYSFRDLLADHARGRHETIPGVLRRANGGVGPETRPLAQTLDELPIPAYDLYRSSPGEEIFIEVGRGCPFQCTFCSTAPFWKRRHRVKSPARILAEIHMVQSLFQPARVHFTHDLLTTDRRWVIELCHTLRAAGVPVQWTCSARTDTVDRELLQTMADAGCGAIYFGLESGSPRILREIRKDIPIEHSLEVLRMCRDAGIRPNAGFIVGFPDEDRDSMQETFSAFERTLSLGVRPTHIFGFCPFAEASVYPRIGALECYRHFLDIPIDPELDGANREWVASDPELFGSYFRPKADAFGTLLYGVDEFSCLVEPVAAPALDLSRALGGMATVYERWTAWISRKNIVAGVPLSRRFYGSPLSFCEFVLEELRAVRSGDHGMVELAEATRTSLRLSRERPSVSPITMSTHRSLETPTVSDRLVLGDRLQLTAVLATMELQNDITPWLGPSPPVASKLEPRPTHLVWRLTEDDRIQLLQVSAFVYAAIERLKLGPQRVAALMLNWTETSSEALDYDRLIGALVHARELGLMEEL
jgi:pyruvate-formate lyase-activating enzyme